MDSQQITTKSAEPLELTDLEDRSRFLKSLGFARDLIAQTNESVATNEDSDGIDDDDGMMLSSNFEDDLELPGSPMLMEPTRSLSEPFGLGELDLEKETPEIEIPEIETRFKEESSFDVAGVDDSTWNAVNHRLRPEPEDWREAEAMLEADLKKKTEQPIPVEPVVDSVSETSKNSVPPPLEDDDEDLVDVLKDSTLDQEIEKAVEPPSNDDEPPSDESLTVNCPSCDRGLTLQPEHLGIPGCCVWCETPIIAAKSGVDQSVGVFKLAAENEASEKEPEVAEKPAAEISKSELSDLPVPKVKLETQIAPQVEEVPEPKEVPESKVDQKPEPTLEPTKTEEKTPEPEKVVEDTIAETADAPTADEVAEEAIETIETIPETKNNFPWNSPTSSKKADSKIAEVQSEAILEEITEPAAEEKATPTASEAVPTFEVLPKPRPAAKPEAIEPLSPMDSPLPEFDNPILNSLASAPAPEISSDGSDPLPKAASPFDPPPEKDEKPATPTLLSSSPKAASPFDPPAPASEEKIESAPVKAQSPFDPPAPATEEKAATEPVKALSPFDPLPKGDEKPSPVADEFSAVSPFDEPESKSADSLPAPKSPSPFNLPAADAVKPTPTPAPVEVLPDSADPMAELRSETPFNSPAPAEAAPAGAPLPWDLPEDKSSNTEAKLPPVQSEDATENTATTAMDAPESQEPFPSPGTAPAIDPAPLEKTRRRKKSSGSKGSRTAITIALLGLISGAGIASFFLPVGSYIERAKSSWTEWFESKIGTDNQWEEAQPSPVNEPVAIPAPTPEPAAVPEVRTASGAEPDPFRSNKGPGS